MELVVGIVVLVLVGIFVIRRVVFIFPLGPVLHFLFVAIIALLFSLGEKLKPGYTPPAPAPTTFTYQGKTYNSKYELVE